MNKIKKMIFAVAILVCTMSITAFADSPSDHNISPRMVYTFHFNGGPSINVSDTEYVGSTVLSGTTVRVVQVILHSLGYSDYVGTVDSIYGTNTKNAIMRFQRSQKLSDDGIVGPNTWRAFYSATNNGDVRSRW